MDNILTKRILTKLGGYLSSPTDMTKPERRCLNDMVTGILKSRSVFVNQIAASPGEPLRPKDTAKRLSAQYLKEDYADKVLEGHLETVAPGVSKNDFIVMDGTDISKKHAKYMEGLAPKHRGSRTATPGRSGSDTTSLTSMRSTCTGRYPPFEQGVQFRDGGAQQQQGGQGSGTEGKGAYRQEGLLGVRPRRGPRNPEGFLYRRMSQGDHPV